MSVVTLNDHIEITPNVVGGKPRITGRRITVQDVVIWHERLGKGVDEIATDHNLTLSEVYSALAYYYDHQSAIDENLRNGKDWIDSLRGQYPSKVKSSGA